MVVRIVSKDKSTTLPSFANPPVIEVVCGVLFKPLEDMSAPHLGLLWEKYRPEYNCCKEEVPLAPVMERFDEKQEQKIRLTQIPPLPRIWFFNEEQSGIVQVQRDRFLHNWKKVLPDQQYPRYNKVITLFEEYFGRFREFVVDSNLGAIDPLQYELTYVNHIPKGQGWESSRDLGSVFPDFKWRPKEKEFLPEPEGVNWATTFQLPNRVGRLHVSILSGTRQDDQMPILQVNLTVRGIASDRSMEGMRDWFDLAREWIVRGFVDLTDSKVQKEIWKRTC